MHPLSVLPEPPAGLRSFDDVIDHVAAAFPARTPGVVGAELEWLVVDVRRPRRPVGHGLVRNLLAGIGPLPGGSTLSYEPGGQVELSSAAAPDLLSCVRALRSDVAVVSAALAVEDLALVGTGTDSCRPPVRLLDVPRYIAMEDYFDRIGDGSAGRTMMCSTASVQVNLESGQPAHQADRWELAHALGPTLVAAFANSPLLGGRPTGWRSTRQAVWFAIDPGRTRPARVGRPGSPIEHWASYAADARLMLVQDGESCRALTEAVPFAAWMADEDLDGCRRPTSADLAYHLTTLFPPVRPRGWLELRMLDAQSAQNWPVAVAVTTALLDDPAAADGAREACEPVRGRWRQAARDGLADHPLATAARSCFALALDALPRLGAGGLVPDVSAYAERYVAVGRTPADDLLDTPAPRRPSDLEPAWL